MNVVVGATGLVGGEVCRLLAEAGEPDGMHGAPAQLLHGSLAEPSTQFRSGARRGDGLRRRPEQD